MTEITEVEALEKGLAFFKELKREDVSITLEPIPFMGLVDLTDYDLDMDGRCE
jgi:hypothetical protein